MKWFAARRWYDRNPPVPLVRLVVSPPCHCQGGFRWVGHPAGRNRSVEYRWDRFPSRSMEGSDMLVLSRKLGEKIYIGENICITVVDIDRGKIRLGIEAPRDVPIYRQELLPLNNQQQPQPPQTQAKSDTPVTLS